MRPVSKSAWRACCRFRQAEGVRVDRLGAFTPILITGNPGPGDQLAGPPKTLTITYSNPVTGATFSLTVSVISPAPAPATAASLPPSG